MRAARLGFPVSRGEHLHSLCAYYQSQSITLSRRELTLGFWQLLALPQMGSSPLINETGAALQVANVEPIRDSIRSSPAAWFLNRRRRQVLRRATDQSMGRIGTSPGGDVDKRIL